MSSKTSLLLIYLFQKMILLDSGFNFALDLAVSNKNVFPRVCYLQ